MGDNLRRVHVTKGKDVILGWFHYWSTYADKDMSSPVGIVETESGEVITPDPSDIVFLQNPG